MKALLKLTNHSKSIDEKESAAKQNNDKVAHDSSVVLANGVHSKESQVLSPKISLFQLKKNKILKDFISGLRKFSGMSE